MLDGVIDAIEQGWFQSEIADASYDFQRPARCRQVHPRRCQRLYRRRRECSVDALHIDPGVEDPARSTRGSETGPRRRRRAVGPRTRSAATRPIPAVNLMPALLDAVTAYVTVERDHLRVGDGLRDLGGNARSREDPGARREVGFDGHDPRHQDRCPHSARCRARGRLRRNSAIRPESVAAIALQEDVDVVGLSMHNGAHLTIAAARRARVARPGSREPGDRRRHRPRRRHPETARRGHRRGCSARAQSTRRGGRHGDGCLPGSRGVRRALSTGEG